jgi:hypothetical protein
MPTQLALTVPPCGMIKGRTLRLALGVGDGPEVGVRVAVGEDPLVGLLVGVAVAMLTLKLLLTATRVAAPAMLNSRV